MYAFWLGREFKLSLAEIYQLFPQVEFIEVSKEFAIISGIPKKQILEKADSMGGVIKICELSDDYKGKPEEIVFRDAEKKEGKFSFGLSVYGEDSTKTLLMRIKKYLKTQDISVRFVNKNFGNLTSAQIIGEKLVNSGTDYSLFIVASSPLNKGRVERGSALEYFGKSIWVQDIEKYSKRDYGKTRDMVVGMLPPKLAQMMINIALPHPLSKKGEFSVYDPFCGLGTILIESILMGNSEVYGSDISPENIEKTKQNINFARKNFVNAVKTAQAFVLDAKGISSSPALKKTDAIVTEGYLGQVFQKYSVSEKKVAEEKIKLLEIYTKFFEGLCRANYKGIIVISFPFWEIRGKYHYFDEIYELIQTYAKNLLLLPKLNDIRHTRSGSLLYKRADQVVGREIFKLKIKK